MNKQLIFIGLVFIFSCKTPSSLIEDRASLKEYAYCKCVEHSVKDTTFTNNDISLFVYRETSNYPMYVFDSIDVVARMAAEKIKPSIIEDYNGKRALMKDCFRFANSKELEAIIIKKDKDRQSDKR